MRGWANYYRYCSDAAKVFHDVENRLWYQMTDWLGRKDECSKNRLIQNKLDSKSPISIGEATLVDPTGTSTIYTKSPTRHSHPYLDDGKIHDQGHWREAHLPGLSQEDPYLANTEERKGAKDVAAQVRARDENTCQCIGCETGGHEGRSLPIHHVRRRRSKVNDRPENMIVLCLRHHDKIHRSGETVKAYHNSVKLFA